MLFCLKKSISKFHVVALALLFAVTVAGCGGGGGGGTAGANAGYDPPAGRRGQRRNRSKR